MESTCAEDRQQISVAYCACQFPLVPLCQEHADKHLADVRNFHFSLPPSAIQVITSEELYMKAKYWLFQLNDNCGLLRKKLQFLANGEDQIEVAYQDLQQFVSEAKMKLKQEFSVKKENLHIEIEKAITEVRSHALEMYEPVDVLAKLLWYNQPHQMVAYQLFDFKAKFNQEHLPSAFHIALNFLPGLENLNIGKWGVALTDQVEELTKQLASLQECHLAKVKTLTQQLEEAKMQETRSQFGLEMSHKIEETEYQLQALQMKYQETETRNITVITENESLKKQCQVQTTQLAEYILCLERNAQLEIQLQELNAAIEETMQKYQALRIECAAKDQRCVDLLLQNTELQKAGKLKKNKLKKSTIKLAEAKNKGCARENGLKKHGIIRIPIESEEPLPDYTTPESRAALDKFGAYSGEDAELMLFKRGPVNNPEGVYIGQWNNRNQRHGYGKLLKKDGSIYEGQWSNDKMTGKGRYIWSHGDVVVGDFVENEFTGFGIRYSADGMKESGMWKNGNMHGLGSCEFPDGEMYMGAWKAGDQFGKGLLRYADGGIYYGDLNNGMHSGVGCEVLPNGDVYQGQWDRGYKSGKGRLTHPGTFEEGVWKDDVLLAKEAQ